MLESGDLTLNAAGALHTKTKDIVIGKLPDQRGTLTIAADDAISSDVDFSKDPTEFKPGTAKVTLNGASRMVVGGRTVLAGLKDDYKAPGQFAVLLEGKNLYLKAKKDWSVPTLTAESRKVVPGTEYKLDIKVSGIKAEDVDWSSAKAVVKAQVPAAAFVSVPTIKSVSRDMKLELDCYPKGDFVNADVVVTLKAKPGKGSEGSCTLRLSRDDIPLPPTPPTPGPTPQPQPQPAPGVEVTVGTNWTRTVGAADADGNVPVELRTTLTSNSTPTKVDVVLSGMTLESVRLLNSKGGEVRISADAEKYTLIVTGKAPKDALAAAKVVSVAVDTVNGFGGTKTVDKPVNEMPDSSHGGGSGGGGCDAGFGALALALAGAFLLLSRRPPSTGR